MFIRVFNYILTNQASGKLDKGWKLFLVLDAVRPLASSVRAVLAQPMSGHVGAAPSQSLQAQGLHFERLRTFKHCAYRL